MFSSSPLDKSCVGPENCSPGRHNSSTRFPVGITSVGDENQQNRIQLAVHKYNSSSSTVLNSRCAVIAPARHNYLKTSLKAKNYDGDTDSILKNEKKNIHQYDGVGAFPTVHLRKSTVRYRPIKKFNDVKIPYPELPVNRFLSHLPEVCPDFKSSTRSVLDVLEDLSGKKIHSKQDTTSNKSLTKGLGGDNLLSPNAVYKPLFVQKPKLNSVLTRDNTTQTLYPLNTETPGPHISNSCSKNNDSDPRAELRRKLAKQNNEIFASLSSSISSSFALKRKIDKVLPARDDEQLTDGLATKKSKMSNNEDNAYSENGISRPNRPRTNLNDSTKSNRRTKFNEAGTPTSPNKDRLTTIFFDMQDTSPKSQIFQNQSTTAEKSVKDGTQSSTNLINGFSHTTDSAGSKGSGSLLNGSAGTSAAESSRKENENPSTGLTEKITTPDTKKPESEQTNKPLLGFPLSKAETPPSDLTKSTSPTFQFGITTSNGSNFTLGKTLTKHGEGSVPTDTLSGAKTENNSEKKDNNNPVLSTLFTFGKSDEKPTFGSFKFGTDKNVSSSTLISSPKETKPQTSNSVPVIATTSSAAAPQFSFVTTTSSAATSTQQPNNASTAQTSPIQFGALTTTTAAAATATISQQPINGSTIPTSGLHFGATTTQDSLSIPSKPSFTFGQAPAPSKENFAADIPTEKKALPNGFQSSVAPTVQGLQPVAFIFDQKSNSDCPTKTISGQNVENQTETTGQCNTVSFSQSATSLSTNSTVSTQSNKSLFSFGQKAESPANATPPASTAEEQKISFSFGKKPNSDQNKPEEGSLQKSTTLFSFGQNSTAQDATKSTPTTTSATSPDQSASAQPTSVFGQSVAQPPTTLDVKFGKTSTPQVLNGLGAKSEAGFLNNTSSPAFSQSNTTFHIKAPLFGSVATVFGSPNSQTSVSFGTPTSSTSGLGFGSPAATQAASAFNSSSAPQNVLAFGVSSAPPSASGFGGPPALQSTSAFGVSSTTQPTTTFGVSSTTQSASTFGVSTTTQSTSAFGVSPSPATSAFGAPSSSVSRFPVQTNTTFEAPAVTSSSGFGASQPSFSQPLGNKSTTSLRQPSSVFGQSPAPGFSSSSAFSSGQNNVQAPSFNTQNKFSFGMSTSNATGFTTSPPKTTAAPVFSFGGNTGGNTFTFGTNSSATNNTQLPFAFKSPTNEPFKFGATNAKEEPAAGFGAATSSATFTFGGQMNNSMVEQKPAFGFGNAQVPSSAPFSFGTTPSPSLFSFGGSTSSSSGSSFNFGTPTPGPFGQTSSASPGTPFAVPGTFSIGSGTSQSRPRATSRPRRRP